ncbi:MAG: hypothetical protein ACLQVD_14160 [Capsulimonadaceae bacterium]
MEQDTQSIIDLAALVLSAERGADTELAAAERTFAKLSVHLSARLGSTGYRALLKRALTLATVDVPWLTLARVCPDGTLEGLDTVGRSGGEVSQGSTAVLARLIELLDTFIGRTLTLRVLHSAWPDAIPIDTASAPGKTNE